MLKFYMVFLLGFLSAAASTRAGFGTWGARTWDFTPRNSPIFQIHMEFHLWALQVRCKEAWAPCS